MMQVLKYLLENFAKGISACNNGNGPGTISIIKHWFI